MPLTREILPEPFDLVHPLVQDRDDADVAVQQAPPIDQVSFVAEHIAVDAELGGDGAGGDAVGLDAREGIEQAGDIAIRLRLAPAVACVAVDVVKTVRSGLLDADGGHRQARLRAMTSAAVRAT